MRSGVLRGGFAPWDGGPDQGEECCGEAGGGPHGEGHQGAGVEKDHGDDGGEQAQDAGTEGEDDGHGNLLLRQGIWRGDLGGNGAGLGKCRGRGASRFETQRIPVLYQWYGDFW